MNTLKTFCSAFLVLLCYSTAFAQTHQQDEIVIYTYDSFVAKGGLGPEIFPLFEQKYGIKIHAIASGDGGQLISRLQLDFERKKPVADVVLGIDQHLLEKAAPYLEHQWDRGWIPKNLDKIVDDAKFKATGFVPYDYGIFAFIADTDALAKHGLSIPTRLSDLEASVWKRNLILEDPRTSTPGLAFLLYTQELHGDDTVAFWKKFHSQWLTLTPGWDQAYGLFLKGEAPLVWSYTTSQAYHREHGDTKGRYRALIFEEGNPIQVEGAAIVRGLSLHDQRNAQLFLEFMLSSEVQKLIPQKNWMFPVVKDTKLPPSFEELPRPKKVFQIRSSAKQVSDALKMWSRAVQ